MAKIGIVETSLRDGNQCLWGALGIDTAQTLTIAPAMERAGYRAIDFTTSTHMGVAVRFKQQDPWERIRAMADVCRNTPLPAPNSWTWRSARWPPTASAASRWPIR
jgi:oxaloacetate decarboxylase alpha subunit